MKQRTIDLLNYCAMPFDDKRWDRLAELCDVYSAKAVHRKLDDLCDKGYIDYGVSTRGAWLTEKGKDKLNELST